MKLSRQRRRYIERELKKIDQTAAKDLQDAFFYKGVYTAVETVEKAMRDEFGFGDKRLKRLEKAIIDELEDKNGNKTPG